MVSETESKTIKCPSVNVTDFMRTLAAHNDEFVIDARALACFWGCVPGTFPSVVRQGRLQDGMEADLELLEHGKSLYRVTVTRRPKIEIDMSDPASAVDILLDILEKNPELVHQRARARNAKVAQEKVHVRSVVVRQAADNGQDPGEIPF